ncbi:MAG: divalent-cation tolerance protein CutA [Nevskiales bacterium]
MSAPEDIRLLYCTCPDTDVAQCIARALVEQRLAACVNIVPGLRSVYRWKGEVQDDAECLLLIKTRESHIVAVTESIRRLHPYELPEVIAVPVIAGLAPYLDWIRDST